MKKLLYFLALGTVLLSACDKGDLVENTPYETLKVDDPKYAYIKILNLTPSSPVSNYSLDGTRFSGALTSSGTENAGYGYNGLFPDLGYSAIAPGAHVLTANIIATAAADKGLEVLRTNIAPEGGKYYTIFTTGIYSTTDKKIPSSVIIEDKKPALDTSKIFIRLVNLYNNSPNIDVTKETVSGTKIFSNIAYGTATEFVSIPAPGNGQTPAIRFFFNNAGTTTTLVTGGVNFTSLTKGRAYTLYLRGIAGSTTFPLSGTTYTTFLY